MPVIKIGTVTDFNGADAKVCLLQGNAARDGELTQVKGQNLGKASVAVGNDMFVTLCGWRGKAADVAAVKKGCSLLATGKMHSREYNGKTYLDMDVDFIALSGLRGARACAAGSAQPANGVPEFTELEDDSDELPF